MLGQLDDTQRELARITEEYHRRAPTVSSTMPRCYTSMA